MPFISAPLLTRLAALGADADVALPRDPGGRHPLCASWSRRVAGRLRANIDAGRLRVHDALDGLDVRELGPDELAELDPDHTVLLNVNTPEDYRKSVR
jgi:molybdopterin-guanine dinucleotide biosynthesis protein A